MSALPSVFLTGELDFRKIFEAIPGRYLVLDRDFQIVAASDGYLEATQHDRDSLVGLLVFEVFPASPATPAASDGRNLRSSLERVLRTKSTDVMGLQQYVLPRPASRGGGFENRFWIPTNSPLLDHDHVAYIIHRVEDVTDLVRLKKKRSGAHETSAWQVEHLEAEVLAQAQQVQEANEKLRFANEGSEALLTSIQDGFMSLDREWRISYINQRGAAAWGGTAESSRGCCFWEISPEPPTGILHRELGRAMAGTAVQFDYFEERTCRWFTKRAYPSSHGLSCYSADITARKTAETRLAVEHSVSRILSESHSLKEAAPALLHSLCHIMDAQVAGLWLLDSQRQELYCADLHQCDNSPEARQFTEESQQYRFLGGTSLPGRVWQEGRPIWFSDLATVGNFTRKKIAAHAGLRSALAFPISNNGEFFGVIEFFLRRLCIEDASLLDTTRAVGSEIAQFAQRRRAEAALRQSEERFRALVTATSDVMYRMNADWSEIQQIFGGTFIAGTDQPSRTWLEEYIPTEDQPLVRAAINKAMHSRSVFESEHHVRRADGSVGWTFSRAVPLLDAQGEIIEWFGTASDITDRKQAQVELEQHAAQLEQAVADRTAQLRETIAELEAFSYSLSHDMRAPLRAIESFTQMVLDESGTKLEPPGPDLLGRVIAAARRLDRLILDVLAFTRVSRSEISIASVDLDRLIAGIIQERPELQPPRAEITVQRPLLRVRGHEASLTQCLVNLLSNAVKFVAPGVPPRVRVWTEPRESLVRVWVADNGIGVAPEAQARLFELFNRLHSGEQYEGFGMGLAIVNRAVQRMGGTVGVESEPGAGSRFWLQLEKGD